MCSLRSWTGSGGQDRLEFRELAGENDGTGPLIDAIGLVEILNFEGDTLI